MRKSSPNLQHQYFLEIMNQIWCENKYRQKKVNQNKHLCCTWEEYTFYDLIQYLNVL